MLIHTFVNIREGKTGSGYEGSLSESGYRFNLSPLDLDIDWTSVYEKKLKPNIVRIEVPQNFTIGELKIRLINLNITGLTQLAQCDHPHVVLM